MDKIWKILVMNLGSTSSKIGYAENENVIFDDEWDHVKEKVQIPREYDEAVKFRMGYVDKFLEMHSLKMEDMDAIAVRGMGNNGSYHHGAYLLTTEVADDVRAAKGGHAGLMAGTLIGEALSLKYNIPAYLYDVVPTDEILEIARVTGIKDYRRLAHSHTLNGRATAQKAAKDLGLDFYNSTFLLSHIGGGTGSMCIKDGVIIDAYSAEEGGFSPIRAGRVPDAVLTKVLSSGDKDEINRVLRKDVGLNGHLGTGDCIEVERRIAEGDKKALLAYQAMAYQLSKDIGALATLVNGKVDAILLTGGVANSKMFTGWMKERLGFIAPVLVYPGTMELEALAGGITRVLNGDETVNDYAETRVEHKLFENL